MLLKSIFILIGYIINQRVEGKKLKLGIKQKNVLLYFTQTVGIIFIMLFLTAYFGPRVFGGLASTATLNNDPNFVMIQSLFGGVLIIFIIIGIGFAILNKKNEDF